MKISKKIRILAWYLKKGYFTQFFNTIKIRFTKSPKTKNINDKEVLNWCEKESINEDEFIKSLGLESHVLELENHRSIFSEAYENEKKASKKMGGPGATNILYGLSEKIKAQTIVETGVAYGWSSLAFLISLYKRDGKLYSIDMPYPSYNNEKDVGIVVPKQFHDNWTLFKKPDISGLPKALNQIKVLDLCHYDSDKSYEGRMRSYHLLWDKIREGGVFISDDIRDNLAFKDFSEKISFSERYVVKTKRKFLGILFK